MVAVHVTNKHNFKSQCHTQTTVFRLRLWKVTIKWVIKSYCSGFHQNWQYNGLKVNSNVGLPGISWRQHLKPSAWDHETVYLSVYFTTLF